MRIALLQCDHVSPELKSRFGDYSDFFIRLFQNQAIAVTLDVFDVQQGEFPENMDDYAGFLSTGSRCSVYDDEPWIKAFQAYVRKLYQQERKFIGICFGHQMMAEALGGKCRRTPNGWGIGVKEVAIQTQPTWMKPRLDQYRLIVSHQDQIVRLPPDTTVIGSNSHCPFSMIAVGNHFLGIQAHPEFTADYAKALMQVRLDRIGLDVVAAAEKTLHQKTDESIIAGWMITFWEK